MAAPIRINRAPVLTLWAAVVAERLGFDRDEALSLGRAVARNAQSRGRRLGVFRPHEEKPEKARDRGDGERFLVEPDPGSALAHLLQSLAASNAGTDGQRP